MGKASSTEIGYLEGVTSNVQDQIDSATGSNSLAVDSVSVAANVNVPNGGSFADMAGWTLTFSTSKVNEVVLAIVQLCVQLQVSSPSGGDGYIGYVLDSDTVVPAVFITAHVTNDGGPLTHVLALTIATPGSHTLKLQAKADGDATMTVFGTTTAVSRAQIQIVKL